MFIVYPQKNNKVAIIVPTGDVSLAIKDVPAGTQYKIVELLDLDNDYFDAYDFDAEVGAVMNITKAKDIHINKLRQARTPLLEKLDLEYMRADEASNLKLKKEIAAKKQALRDVTKTELPDDLEGIKATWPEILGKNPFNS